MVKPSFWLVKSMSILLVWRLAQSKGYLEWGEGIILHILLKGFLKSWMPFFQHLLFKVWITDLPLMARK